LTSGDASILADAFVVSITSVLRNAFSIAAEFCFRHLVPGSMQTIKYPLDNFVPGGSPVELLRGWHRQPNVMMWDFAAAETALGELLRRHRTFNRATIGGRRIPWTSNTQGSTDDDMTTLARIKQKPFYG
jgi:hypothetical protein